MLTTPPRGRAIVDEIHKAQAWLDDFGASASGDDFDEQRESFMAQISPITSKVVRRS